MATKADIAHTKIDKMESSFDSKLSKLKKPKPSFIEFMRKSPFVGIKLYFRRKKDFSRDIDL